MSPLHLSDKIVLADEVVRLRPLRADDLDAFIAHAQAEPFIWEYSPIWPNTPEAMATYIATALEGRHQGHSYPFTVEDPHTGQIVGSTRLYDYQPLHQRAMLGYTWYGAAWRGSGLNTSAKALLLRWCFEELQLLRLGFEADAANGRSIKAMQKIGAQVEGILRSHATLPNGRRRDTILLSILRHEWQANKG